MNKEYVILFINSKKKKPIFMSKYANIKDLCRNEKITLPGTYDFKDAKIYSSIEEAKKDIYDLRYHFRAFLKIQMAIISIQNLRKSLELAGNKSIENPKRNQISQR